MKIYTIEDLETFERDDDGRLICPTGDYSQIKHFNGAVLANVAVLANGAVLANCASWQII